MGKKKDLIKKLSKENVKLEDYVIDLQSRIQFLEHELRKELREECGCGEHMFRGDWINPNLPPSYTEHSYEWANSKVEEGFEVKRPGWVHGIVMGPGGIRVYNDGKKTPVTAKVDMFEAYDWEVVPPKEKSFSNEKKYNRFKLSTLYKITNATRTGEIESLGWPPFYFL